MFGGRNWLHPENNVVHGMARSRQKIRADGLDAYYLQLQIGETIRGYAGEAAARIAPGDLCLLDLASPFDLEVTTGDTVCMVIPRDILPARVADLHGRSLMGGMGNILSDYLFSLRKNLASLSADEFLHASHATKHVLQACLAPTRESVRQAETELDKVTVNRIKAFIDTNLLSPDLSPDRICREMAISRAKLYRLLEPTGGVMCLIQCKRLHRARRKLMDPFSPRTRISEIAWQHGFVSESHFTRLFSKKFGCSPREMASLKLTRFKIRSTDGAPTGHANLGEWMRTVALP
jgi:AraC-like DNA-binding protein